MPKEFHTKLAGVSKLNSDGTSRQEYIQMLDPEEGLELVRQPENSYDPNAVAVFDSTGNQIGYLSSQVAAEIAPEIDRGMFVECYVVEITGQDQDTQGVNVLINVMTLEEAGTKYKTSSPVPVRSKTHPIGSTHKPFSSSRIPISSKVSKPAKPRKVNPNPKSPKSIVILLILWLTLGYLGGHRMYAGRGSWLYTLTLGYLTIGWILDLFVILFGRFEDNHGRQIRF